MKKKTTKDKNEVLQLTLEEIMNYIIPEEKYIDIFGHCKNQIEYKNDKLIVKISNEKNDISMSIDITDIANHFGYKLWNYIEVVDYGYYKNTSMVDSGHGIPMIQFHS